MDGREPNTPTIFVYSLCCTIQLLMPLQYVAIADAKRPEKN